jgi:hypothetical protein
VLDALWSLTADVIRTGWNVDKLPPSPKELIPLVRSHRAPEPPVPTSLVPDAVAHVADEDCWSSPLRSLAWLQGVKR